MKRYLLDTSALLALRDDEPGADQVTEILFQAQNNHARVYGSFMTQMELYYRIWKDEGETEGRLAFEQCKTLPIEWINESPELLMEAARVKATHSLSLADAWIVATAFIKNGILVHKDPEFAAVDIEQLTLPFKRKMGDAH